MIYYFNIIQGKDTRFLAGPFHSEDNRKMYEEQTNDIGIKVVGKIELDVSDVPKMNWEMI